MTNIDELLKKDGVGEIFTNMQNYNDLHNLKQAYEKNTRDYGKEGILISEDIQYGSSVQYNIIFESLKELIQEETFEIDSDVDFLYKKLGLEKFLQDYKDNPSEIYRSSQYGGVDLLLDSSVVISSEDLPSNISQKAHKINPITIKIDSQNTQYDVVDNEIQIGLRLDAIRYLGQKGLDQENIATSEFSENRLKDKISHELNHWLEESFYDNKSSKTLSKYKSDVKSLNPNDYSGVVDLQNKLKYTSSSEIESLVQQVKQHKRGNIGWNDYNMIDLFKKIPTVRHYLISVYDKISISDYKKFVKTLFIRLNREKLLTKKMIRDFQTSDLVTLAINSEL